MCYRHIFPFQSYIAIVQRLTKTQEIIPANFGCRTRVVSQKMEFQPLEIESFGAISRVLVF
jgi:hypothetical protein